MKKVLATLSVLSIALLLACSPDTSGPTTESAASAAEATLGEATPATNRSFVNRVWVVAESEQVAAGDLRIFLSEGTMVMASENGTPAFGTWRQDGKELVITEGGRDYPVDVLELAADRFRIRIRGPGEPIEVRFAEAETQMASLGR